MNNLGNSLDNSWMILDIIQNLQTYSIQNLFKKIQQKNDNELISDSQLLKINFDQQTDFIFQPLEIPKILPEIKIDKKYSLVIDLDETLVHYQENESRGKFYIRPYTQHFLEILQNYYELIIFTAARKQYADWILDKIDQKKTITHRLYRIHTIFEKGVYNKDLSILGRDLRQILIIDNNSRNFQRQPENGICIKGWFDDPEDKALYQLSEILIEVAQKQPYDLRVELKNVLKKNHH